MTTCVNLIGLFRSGTNYARTILEWNYDVKIVYDGYGWKHAMVPTFSEFSKFSYPDGNLLVVVKNPYSAMLSWYRYAKRNGRNIAGDTRSLSSFVRNKVRFRDDTNKTLAPEYYFSDPVQMWNSVTWNHLSVADQTGGFVVEYDDLLRKPEETTNKIAHHMGLTRKTVDFMCPTNIVRNMNDNLGTDNKARYLTKKTFSSEYHLGRNYVREYRDDDLAFVAQSIDPDVIRRSGIKLDHNCADERALPKALYTLSGDTRLLSCACFLESNRVRDALPIYLIPFDEDISMTKELAELYSAQFVIPDPKWDRLGKAVFGEEEYRPGVPSWKYFRKLNVFNGSSRPILFVDGSVVLLNSLHQAFDALQTHDLVFGDRSKEGRNFKPWATQLLNILDPNLRNGFNASFWVTRCNLFSDLDVEGLVKRPNFRVMLGKAPEQSFMQLMAVLLRKRIGALGEINQEVRPTLWGDVTPGKEISHALEHNRTRNGKIPLAVKWSGAAFHKKEAIKSAEIYESLYGGILSQTMSSRRLVNALNEQYRIALRK